MERDFWINKWENETEHGFHKDHFHPLLLKHFPTLKLPSHSNILVPLCGKTLDLLWFKTQGHKVIGIELSPIACRQFFEENELQFEEEEHPNFQIFRGKDITLYCGDFFQITPENIPHIHGVYDRAAIVALPLEMRQAYYKKLNELLKTGAQILMITFEYDHPGLTGPPFSISRQEIKEYTQKSFIIEELDKTTVEIKSKRFIEAGATSADEYTLRLSKR